MSIKIPRPNNDNETDEIETNTRINRCEFKIRSINYAGLIETDFI